MWTPPCIEWSGSSRECQGADCVVTVGAADGKEDGEFEAVVRPRDPELRHLPTGEVFPLRWEDRTLKLAAAKGTTGDAKRLSERLAQLAKGRVGSGAVGIPPMSAKGSPNRAAEARRLAKETAVARIAALGSAAFRLSRRHLLTLARDLGAHSSTCRDATKKQLFRLVAGALPDGVGAGLRPGRPGREIP